jgi:hypothetical protein
MRAGSQFSLVSARSGDSPHFDGMYKLSESQFSRFEYFAEDTVEDVWDEVAQTMLGEPSTGVALRLVFLFSALFKVLLRLSLSLFL